MDFLKDLKIIPRAVWNASEPKNEEEIKAHPAPYVVIYHDNRTRCNNRLQCNEALKTMQKEHMENGESDILYHYIVTRDGTVYEGRSTKNVGKKFPDSEKEFYDTNYKSITVGCLDHGDPNLTSSMMLSLIALVDKLRNEGLVDLDIRYKIYFPEGHPNRKKSKNVNNAMSAIKMNGKSTSNRYRGLPIDLSDTRENKQRKI